MERNSNFYPHFTHELDGLFRFGGCIPAIHAKADIATPYFSACSGSRRAAACWSAPAGESTGPGEVGTSRRRIGLSRSLNPRKVDYRRVTDERGVEVVLRLHGVSHEVVGSTASGRRLVRGRRKVPLAGLTEFWGRYGAPTDLRHRPLLPELEAGMIDACFVTDPFDLGYPDYPGFSLIGSLARQPDWTLQVGGAPYALTCTRPFADEHPDLVTAYLRDS